MANGNQNTETCGSSPCSNLTWAKCSNLEVSPDDWSHWRIYLMQTTADYMGIKLTGKLDPCEACAQAKIRQANIPRKKEPQDPSRPGYRLFIDISSFKHESMGGKRHWLIVVD